MDEGGASSTPSSVDFYEADKKPSSPEHEPPDGAASKRKAGELAPASDKRRKLASPSPYSCAPTPCAGLPAAVWQHVFLFCSLYDLGRLLQVNRAFHFLLSDVRNVLPNDPQSGSLRLLKSESLWASARNALPVKPPKPLPGFSESQMWQIAWGRRCQFCSKQSSFTPGEKIWQHGPGASGVRTIWPFGIRCCGPCLMARCKTDASLLFSNASALRPALPFAFITSDQHYIPAYTLQAATTPASVEIAKYYYAEHVDDITKELHDALGLGTAAAEEWSKGLDARGKERMKLVELWERWEVKYQWWSDHNQTKQQASAATADVPPTNKEPHRLSAPRASSPVIYAPVPASKYPLAPLTAGGDSAASRFDFIRHAQPVPSLTPAAPAQAMHARPPTIPPHYTPQPTPGGTLHSSRGERNLHDANEARAMRKADIERRCQEMDPPIPPNVLRHMDSFRAALHIYQPMTEDAWNVLKPRLLAQLAAAQQAEADYVSKLAALPRTTDRRHLDANSKEAKEVLDREWEELQRPFRDKLNAIADDFINQDWARGTAVTYESSPKFAADLLMHVRRVYYGNSKDAPSGQKQPECPKLVLENMKWVYDNKVKPLTEQLRKELFLCYGQGCETNYRFYGFEGVVQHFGAKHTNAFSVGNVVVAWREAEWPEEPPFHPDPISVKPAYHAAPNAGNHAGYGGAYYGGYSRAGTSTPHMPTHMPQASPGPYNYGGHYNGPFAPPQMAGPPTSVYDYPQVYGDPYQYQAMATSSYGPLASHGYMTSPVMPNSAVAPPPAGPAHVAGILDTLHKADESNGRTNLSDKQVSAIVDMAREIWDQTSGIKDFPISLRIYVLLQHIIIRFHVQFNHEPTLNLIVDAFSSSSISKDLKDASGLACKACQVNSLHAMQQEERKTYTTLELLLHFQSQHAVFLPPGYGPGNAPLDWKENLVELPGERFISGLIHAPGMDDDKLHMVATVFPRLFPTPLPKIGAVNIPRVVSPVQPLAKDPKEGPVVGGASGVSTDQSGPPSLDSPYTGPSRPPNAADEGYDPERPVLPQANAQVRFSQRKLTYRGSPPADRRPRFYYEPQYYVPVEDEYGRPQFIEYASSPRRMLDPAPHYDEYQDRRPVYRDEELRLRHGHGEMVYAQHHDGAHVPEYKPTSRHVHYMDEEGQSYRYGRVPMSREPSPSGENSAANRYLEDLLPGRPPTNESGPLTAPPPKASGPDPDVDDGSRYTPPPPSLPPMEQASRRSHNGPVDPRPPSTMSNGSRYEEQRRQVPTPESARGSRRPGPHRRRDRYHEHRPTRFARYMNIAREEPYARGASMSRSQSKRYEQQRRQFNQQETPQPPLDPDQAFSRDHSVERTPADDPAFAARPPAREYVSVQDRLRPFSPPRYRYGPYHEDPRNGPPPFFVDEYERPVEEFEIIRVPRARAPYHHHQHPPARYVDPDDQLQFVSVPYNRIPAQRYQERHPEYAYFPERGPAYPERGPRPQSAGRRAPLEAEDAYEPPPEIKVEQGAGAGAGAGEAA